MEEPKLKVKIRDRKGKGYARKLRREGNIPAILYGHHLRQSIPLEVELKEFRGFLSSYPGAREKVFILELADQKMNNQREVIVKDIQYDPLKRVLRHIDFYEITRGEKVTTVVPLSFVGEAKGVKKGGVVECLRRELEVECLPIDIPSAIEVDITLLDIGDHLSIKDLKISSKIKLIAHPEDRVVSVVSPVRREEIEKIEEEVKVSPEEVEVVGKKKEEEEKESEEVSREQKRTG